MAARCAVSGTQKIEFSGRAPPVLEGVARLCSLVLPCYHWCHSDSVVNLGRMARFLLTFGGVLIGLFTLEMLKPVQETIIQPFTGLLAMLSTAIILPFDDSVIAQGRVLRDAATGFAVSIEAGCNGVEAAIVLIAGIMAFPARTTHKLVAISAGFIFVQALNIVRIISLFYLGQWNYSVFEWFHLYLWPVLIMLDVLVVFALYLSWLGRHAQALEEY